MTDLIKYDAACRAIAEARSADEIMKLRATASGLRELARAAKNFDGEIQFAEIRIRAERRLGEMLLEQKHTVGLAKGGQPYQARNATGNEIDPVERPATLAEAGIEKNLSARAQKLAAIPAEKFEEDITGWRSRCRQTGERVTTDLLSSHRKAEARAAQDWEYRETVGAGCDLEDLNDLIQSGRRFPVLYLDPPWSFQTYSDKGQDRAPRYDCQSVEEICAMPFGQLASKDCVLLLWTTAPFLQRSFEVITAYGFTYSTIGFSWTKVNDDEEPTIGTGYWTRANVELCLLATKGSPQRINKDVRQALIEPTGEHSAKPEEFAARIERLVAGPYFEGYARRVRPGWTCWGNEIPRQIFRGAIG